MMNKRGNAWKKMIFQICYARLTLQIFVYIQKVIEKKEEVG